MARTAETLSIIQLMNMFPTNDAAIEWLERARWGNSPACAHCGSTTKIRIAKSANKKWHRWCTKCSKYFTVTTKTIMHSSNIPVRLWLIAIYATMTARKGVSSLQMSKELGIGYKATWFMMHRIRKACIDTGFQLSEVVEIDEAYFGGRTRTMKIKRIIETNSGQDNKMPVVGFRQRGGNTIGISLKDVNKTEIFRLIRKHIKPGATIYTDDSRLYSGLMKWIPGYTHETVNHSAKEFVHKQAHINGIESVWAVLKRGYVGTFHDFSHKHLHRYVSEFAFRLSGGNCSINTKDRMENLLHNIGGRQLRYADLVS